MFVEGYHEGFYREDLTLEKALHTVAPLFVNSLIKKHPSLMLALVLADLAVEVKRHGQKKKKFGKLVLIKNFQ